MLLQLQIALKFIFTLFLLVHRPHAFKAVYTVTLHEEQLRTDLRVINTGNEPFDFTAAMHTYIEVLDIEVCCSQYRLILDC